MGAIKSKDSFAVQAALAKNSLDVKLLQNKRWLEDAEFELAIMKRKGVSPPEEIRAQLMKIQALRQTKQMLNSQASQLASVRSHDSIVTSQMKLNEITARHSSMVAQQHKAISSSSSASSKVAMDLERNSTAIATTNEMMGDAVGSSIGTDDSWVEEEMAKYNQEQTFRVTDSMPHVKAKRKPKNKVNSVKKEEQEA